MIISWQCDQCGWMNDNNFGDCRRCGGNTEYVTVRGRTKEVILKKANPIKITNFDAERKIKEMAKDGAVHDRRR